MRRLRSVSPHRRFAALLAIVASTAAIAYVLMRGTEMTPESLRAAIGSWGPWGPLLYVVLVSARPFILFPSTLLFIAGGLAFGPLWGTVLAAIGGTVAAVVTFLLARALGRDFVQRQIPDSVRRLQAERWGVGLVFFLNLVPLVPLTAVNYGAGLSTMALETYTIGVIAGLTPRALAFAFFGDSLLEIGSGQFWFAVAVLVLLVAVPIALRRRWRAS